MIKTFSILTILLLVTGCSGVKYNAVSFGKKCAVSEAQGEVKVATSYVWLYHKDTGLHANKTDCAILDK